jgi:hypothetical protein
MKLLLMLAVLLLPVAARAQSAPPSQTPIRLVISAAIIAHSADLSTTAFAFGKSGDRYREANPILRPFAGDPVTLAVAKMGTAVALNYGLFRLYQHKPKTAIAAGVMQVVAIGYVAHRNAQLLGLR